MISTTIILTQAWVFIIPLRAVFKQPPYRLANQHIRHIVAMLMTNHITAIRINLKFYLHISISPLHKELVICTVDKITPYRNDGTTDIEHIILNLYISKFYITECPIVRTNKFYFHDTVKLQVVLKYI